MKITDETWHYVCVAMFVIGAFALCFSFVVKFVPVSPTRATPKPTKAWFINKNHDIEATQWMVRDVKNQIATFIETYGSDRSKWNEKRVAEWNLLISQIEWLIKRGDDQVAEYSQHRKRVNHFIFKSWGVPDWGPIPKEW